LPNVGVRFGQEVEQAPRPRPLAGLQRGSVVPGGRLPSVHLHQQVDIEIVIILLRREVGGAQLLTSHFGAGGFNDVEGTFNLPAGFDGIATLSLHARDTKQHLRL
jgi:hypothetical protein